MIPPFDPDTGYLPPGIHPANWDEFVGRYGATEHRQQLLAGLREALECLRDAGCCGVYLDGSFVTAKDEPADGDGLWILSGVKAA